MSSRTLNSAPSWGAVARAQLRMVALLQRRDFAVLAALCLALIVVGALGYSKLPPTIPDLEDMAVIPIFPVLAFPLGCIAVLWPLGVWRREDPARRGYFWSLPVAQGQHTLLRVAVGWLLLMAVCVTVMLLAILLAVPLDARYDETRMSLAYAWVPLLIPTLPYLFFSALVVAFENPVRVVAWVAAAGWAIAIVVEVIDDLERVLMRTSVVSRVIVPLAMSLGSTFAAPVMGPYDGWSMDFWVAHYLGWFGLGMVLLLIAAFRRQETN